MKNFKSVLLLLMVIVIVASCEKDDICVSEGTPLLVIEFFNATETDALKNVNTLRVVGVGQTVTVNTLADRSTTNKITLPLKTNEEITSFILISNSSSDANGIETGNADTINFSYQRLERFESRGCGIVVNYNDLKANTTTDTNNWIQQIEILQSLVTNSDSTHVKIFH